MKIIISKEKLLCAMNVASTILNRSTFGGAIALKVIWFSKENDNNIKISCTDMEMEFVGIYEAKVVGEKRFGVIGKNFFDLIKKFKKDNVEIDLDTEKSIVHIKSGMSKYNIPQVIDSMFVDTHYDSFSWYDIEIDKIIQGIAGANICTSDTPDAQTGAIAIRAENNEVSIWGTNSVNLFCYTIKDEHFCEFIKNNGKIVIINKFFVNEIIKFLNITLKNGNTNIQISLDKNTIFLKNDCEMLRLPRRISEYTFLDDIIYMIENYEDILCVPKQDFISSLERLSILTSENFSSFSIQTDGNLVVLALHDTEKGSGEELFECQYVKGKYKNQIVLHLKSMLDLLKITQEKVYLYIGTQEQPFGIKTEDKSIVMVTMPMRI